MKYYSNEYEHTLQNLAELLVTPERYQTAHNIGQLAIELEYED